MKLPEWIRRSLTTWAVARTNRPPDFELEDENSKVYLWRWHIIPPNRLLSLYVHFIAGPDRGRHLHDHRSGTLSVILEGNYVEVHSTPQREARQLERQAKQRTKRDVVYRPARQPHMIIATGGAVTIFITGPTWRTWGFWVDGKWIPHAKYIAEQATGPK